MFNHLKITLSDYLLEHFHIVLALCILWLIVLWMISSVRFFKRLDKSFLTVLIVFVLPALILWTFYFEQQILITRNVTIPIKNLPKKFENYKIVFISDTHTCNPYTKLAMIKRAAKLANKQKPDLLLLGGDYEVTGLMFSKHIEAQETAKILKNINAKYGKYCILGNHDYFNGRIRIETQLKENGFNILRNESINIGTSESPLYLTGLGDFEYGDTDFITLLKLPKNAPIIVLVHEPDAFPTFPQNISLTLTGHTHGGQIRLPFIGALKTPSAYGNKYSKGLIKEGKKQLFVTSGIGTSILPVRFYNPPEIAVITLKRS